MKIEMTEKKLKEILEESKPIFTIIDEIGKGLRTKTTLDKEFYYTSLDRLSGCFTYLSPLHKKLEAIKKNNELDTYIKMRDEYEVKAKKFTNAEGDRISSHSVKDLRLVRNIVEGYLLAAECAINTCKKHISGYEKERELEA